MPHYQANARLRRNLSRAGITTLALTAFALGVVGFARKFPDFTWIDATYASLQLFVLQTDVARPPWQLELARFLAPAATIVTATLAGLALFRDEWAHNRLRRARGHVVICGAGAKGAHLASEFLAAGDTVVVVESDPDQPIVTRLRQARALVVAGDITEPETLVQARVAQARLVVAMTGSDDVNVTVAAHARALAARAGRSEADPLTCLAHVVDPELHMLLQRRGALSAVGCTVRLVDSYALAARRFFADHPLELALEGPEDPRPVHLIILGFGNMGRALLLQALRSAHYANLQPLRVTVVDRDAGNKAKRLGWTWPHVGLACRLQVIEGDFLDPAVLARLSDVCAAESALHTVTLCLDSDARALTAALRVREALRAVVPLRLAVRLTRGGELVGLLAEPGSAQSPGNSDVVIMGSHAQALHRGDVLVDGLDAQARAVHEDFVAERLAEGANLADPKLAAWAQLPMDIQDSNRQQADHIPVKLRAIGCGIADGRAQPPFTFSAAEVEVLAKMEHARWVADRVLSGWTLGPKDTDARRTPYLVGWEALDEQIREWDREPVRNIPALLERVGRHVVRVEAPGRRHA